MRYMSAQQVRDHLRKECEKAGGQKAWADAHGISQPYLSDVLAGKRDTIGDKVLDALGLEERVTYRKKQP